MTTETLPCGLTEQQKAEIRNVLTLGCDRETAAHVIGYSLEKFVRALQLDPEFAIEMRRTEAKVEFRLMAKICEAAQDPKNWRICMWWLERRAPERFAARTPGAITTRHLNAYIEFFGESLVNDIHNDEDRARVQARLDQIGALCRLLEDNIWEAPDVADNFSAGRGVEAANEERSDLSDSLTSVEAMTLQSDSMPEL